MAHTDSPRQPLAVLVSNFGYAPPPTSKRKMSSDPVTKRRKIELADPSTTSVLSRKPEIAANDPPKKRAKAPKKKPQTVTAVATAAYQPPAAEVTIDASSKFFNTGNESEAPPKKKRARKSKVTFAEPPPPPPLYTPIKASKQADSQDFLFGTSSQLAAPESPSFIRQMQAAIAQSELQQATQAMPVSPAKRSSLKVPTAPHGTSLTVGQAERELWRSAARDFNDGLLRENSGLRSGTKKAPPRSKLSASRTITTVSEPPVTIDTGKKVEDAPHDSFIDIDDISDHEPQHHTPSPPRRKASALPRPPQPLVFDITSSSPAPFTEEAPPTKSPAMSPPKSLPKKAIKKVPKKALPKENATSKLAKKRANKKATVRKPENGPPAIDVTVTDTLVPEHSPMALPSAIPPSDLAVFDKSPPKLTGISANARISPTDPQWTVIRSKLFPQITSTIKTAARSTDPEKPSWHHKILLYDPIVLEDLTTWLNEQTLRIGVERLKAKNAVKGQKKKAAAESEPPADGEATKPKKGTKKKAIAEPEAPAVSAAQSTTEIVEEELQPWMVQKWCEEKSICCLWKEGLRGGVRSRY